MSKAKKSDINLRVVASQEDTKWWKSPWAIGLGSAIIGGLVVGVVITLWQSSKAHDAEDLRTNVKLEVTNQLAPFDRRLQEQAEAVAKIKGALGIALNDLKDADQNVFAKSLPMLQAAMRQASPQTVPDQKTIQTIAEKLSRTTESAPEYWPTVLQFISFVSSRSVPNVPRAGPPWSLASTNSTVSGHEKNAAILIDGGVMEDFTCEHCRIVFTEKQVRIRNVTFIACVFDFPEGPPSPVIKEAARVLLASGLQRATLSAIG